ncbi:MAG: hypothetical protein JO000_02555 [Alphaproteobacteria bacterium]|nr:hypothetical protein [Alphaproteobacteria bacterium]
MRFKIILTIAAFTVGFLAPAGIAATSARAANLNAPAAADALFAARKKKKRTRVETNKEEYLKAAPGTGPSGPPTK